MTTKVQDDRRVPTKAKVEHPTVAERVARGQAARAEVPRSAHAEFDPGPERPDPVALLERQAKTRVPELVPIRYGRMLVSPFTFYRGAAADHGRRPGRARRPPGLQRAALRRRPPLELRRLRHPRAAPGLRRQRLRRDPAGAVRVGRQAPGGQLRGRRPRPRLRRPPTREAVLRACAASYRSAMAGFAEP